MKARLTLTWLVVIAAALGAFIAGCTGTMPPTGEEAAGVTTIKGGIGGSTPEHVKQLTEAEKAAANAAEFYRVREIGKAVENYERALGLDPELTEAYYGLGHIYLVETQEFDKALAMYEKARDLAPGDPYSRSSLAYAYFLVGRYQESVTEYIEAAALSPEDADVFLNLGYAYEKMMMDLAALNAYRRALELMPEDPRPAQTLAQLCYRAELHDQAIAAFERVRMHGNASAYVLSTLGYCYMKVGAYASAENLFLAVLAKTPDDIAARANLATVYRSTQQYAKAIQQYDALVQANPNDPTYMAALADAYNDAGQYESAIGAAKRLLALTPGRGTAYIPWAKALEKQGQYEGAITQLQKAVADPEWKSYALNEIERQNKLIEIAEQRKLRQIWDQGGGK